jgi:ABC-type nitrate/sulfonate/bicarbonate transport system permease component
MIGMDQQSPAPLTEPSVVPASARTATRLAEAAIPALTVVVFVLAWEMFVRLRGIAPIYLPAPSSIAVYLWRMIIDGSMEYHLGVTLLRIFAGFLLAAVTGILLGVLMGMSRVLARIADAWIAALYPLPKISLIPLLIIWLGTGEAYKIVISAVSAFFPIVISTYSGIRQVDRGLLKAAKDLGANRRQIQLKVVIPAAIPSILAGLQLGMGVTIILVVAAEMIGGSSQGGMGYLLITAGQVMETEKVFASLVVLAFVGAAIIKLQQWIDRKVAPWVVHDR